MSWKVARFNGQTERNDYLLLPYPENREATIRKRRIGYEVRLKGLMVMERGGRRWNLTLRAARRRAHRWVYQDAKGHPVIETIREPRRPGGIAHY